MLFNSLTDICSQLIGVVTDFSNQNNFTADNQQVESVLKGAQSLERFVNKVERIDMKIFS